MMMGRPVVEAPAAPAAPAEDDAGLARGRCPHCGRRPEDAPPPGSDAFGYLDPDDDSAAPRLDGAPEASARAQLYGWRRGPSGFRTLRSGARPGQLPPLQRPLAASGLLRPRARPRASDEASEDSLSFSRLDAMPQHERQLIRFEAKPKRGRRSGERETAQILAQVAEAEATALGLRDRGPELRHHPLTTPAF